MVRFVEVLPLTSIDLRITKDTELGYNDSIKQPKPMPVTPFPNRGKRKRRQQAEAEAEAKST
jgi:hypothetical protein